MTSLSNILEKTSLISYLDCDLMAWMAMGARSYGSPCMAAAECGGRVAGFAHGRGWRYLDG